MEILSAPQAMQAWAKAQRQQGATLGLVPTMGFLHEGHLSLVRLAASQADQVVVSIFVNPTQFGPNEDLAKYPRSLERDCELLAKEGVAAVFTPTPKLMYPAGFQTEIKVPNLSQGLCGQSRPSHFSGVATVVTKLFNIVQPDLACFGEKDFQQLAIIRRLVADLNLPLRILGGPIVREADGLAMSSRNSYLNAEDRQAALILSQALAKARELYAAGELQAEALLAAVRDLIHSEPKASLDYASLVDAHSLEPVAQAEDSSRLLLAVYIAAKVRLIDNCSLR